MSNYQIEIALANVRQSQLRAEHYNTRIQTGVYKDRIVRHGSMDGPLYSEAELLKDEVATMNRHIQLAEERLEYAKMLLELDHVENKSN